jgi:hypothetical protein
MQLNGLHARTCAEPFVNGGARANWGLVPIAVATVAVLRGADARDETRRITANIAKL